MRRPYNTPSKGAKRSINKFFTEYLEILLSSKVAKSFINKIFSVGLEILPPLKGAAEYSEAGVVSTHHPRYH
jgi:hypothetical protein